MQLTVQLITNYAFFPRQPDAEIVQINVRSVLHSS